MLLFADKTSWGKQQKFKQNVQVISATKAATKSATKSAQLLCCTFNKVSVFYKLNCRTENRWKECLLKTVWFIKDKF